MKNNKGFTLVELLATIAILAVIGSITIYIALSVVKSAKEKTYETTKANVTSNVSSYLLERGRELSFVKTSDGLIEYQCVLVKNLVDLGYLDNKVMDAKVSEDRTVMLDDYIYVERDTTTKAITKSIYIVDSGSTYGNVCGAVERLAGVIEFSSNPAVDTWSQSKEITIMYRITNINDINTFGDYQYNYVFRDDEDNRVASDSKTFNDYYMTNGFIASVKGSVNAKIVRSDGVTVATGTHPISKIDRTGPVVNITNPTGNLYTKATIVINVSDTQSGVNYNSFTQDDIEVSIGGTGITTFTLTKKDNNGNYNLTIEDTEHYGEVVITIKSNSILDNVGNANSGNRFPLSVSWKKVVQTSSVACASPTPVYDGTEKTIVSAASTGYTWVSGATRTNAGSQEATARLSEGYIWNDGNTGEKKINCSITARPITITAKAQTINYGSAIATGTGQVTVVTLATGDTLNSINLAASTTSVTTSGTITPSSAVIKRGTTDVTSNYNISYSNGTLTINSINATCPTLTAYSGTYDGSSHTITVGNNASGGTVQYRTSTTGSWSTNVPSRTNAGTTTVYVRVNGDDNHNSVNCYTSGTDNANIVISARSITVTATNQSKTYDGSALNANATCSKTSGVLVSGHTVTCTSAGNQTNAGSNTKTLSTVTIKNSSNTDVTSNYEITKVDGTLTVNKRAITVTATNQSKNYDGNALNADTTCSRTSGTLVSGHTITCENTGSQTDYGYSTKTLRTVTIKNSSNIDLTGNYEITKVDGTLTVNKVSATCPTLTPYSGTYDGSSHTITVGNNAAGGTVQYRTSTTDSWGTTLPSRTDVGTTTVYVRVSGDNNHNDATCDSKTITISKRVVTVTADNKTIEYGSSAPSFTYSKSGQVSGETAVSGTASYTVKNSSGTTVTVNSSLAAGTYTITPSGLTAGGNYTISYANGTLTVSAPSKTDATCPTLTPYSGTYDGSSHSITVGNNAVGGTVQYRTSTTGSWGTTKPSRTDAGTTTVYVRVSGDNSHNDVTCGSKTITISKRVVTVTADNKTIEYGSSAPSFTYSKSGQVSGETAVSGTASYTVKNSSGTTVTVNSSLAAGTYTITPSGLTAGGNYTISYANGTLTVSKVDATCPTITAYSGQYDGSSHSITVGNAVGGTVQYRTSTTGSWGTTKPSRTDAGTTTVYVRVNGDSNHNTVACNDSYIRIMRPSCWYIRYYSSRSTYCRTTPQMVDSNGNQITSNQRVLVGAGTSYGSWFTIDIATNNGTVAYPDASGFADDNKTTTTWYHSRDLDCWLYGGYMVKETRSDNLNSDGSCGTASSASPPAGGCFLAGTKVRTAYGYKDIDKVTIGDLVLSYNEKTGKNEYKRVDEVFVHNNNTEDLYSLIIDGKELQVTSAHRFYIRRGNVTMWLAANKLKIGDKVRYADGTYHVISDISFSLQTNTVYNLNVADNHNYYVSEEMILVHNSKVNDACSAVDSCYIP